MLFHYKRGSSYNWILIAKNLSNPDGLVKVKLAPQSMKLFKKRDPGSGDLSQSCHVILFTGLPSYFVCTFSHVSNCVQLSNKWREDSQMQQIEAAVVRERG